MTPKNKYRKPVAVFNSSYLLVAIFRSIKEAASITGIIRQSIIKAISGEIVSVKNCYWRSIPQDFVLDQDDIGVLSVIDFDKEVGNPDRKIWGKGKIKKRKFALMESEHKS